MRLLLRSAAFASVFALVSCSSGDHSGRSSEPTDRTQQAQVGICTVASFGQPCAPSWSSQDAAPGLTECSGVCWLFDGKPECLDVANVGMKTSDLNGRVCGSTAGTSCKSTCLNGACVAIDAKPGTACRLTESSNSCSGACLTTASGLTCTQLGPDGSASCPFGALECTFRACDMLNVTQCASFALLSGTSCNDNNPCTVSDSCNAAGQCVPGQPKNCTDLNVCTTDTCDPKSGACIGVPNGNACDDGDPCTSNDHCNPSNLICAGSPISGCISDSGVGGNPNSGGSSGSDASLGGSDGGPFEGGDDWIGSGGSPSGGASAGGAAGAGAMPTGGAGFGGTPSGGGSGLQPPYENGGGSSPTGGAGGSSSKDSGTGTDAGIGKNRSDSDSGCGCRVDRPSNTAPEFALALISAALVMIRRRRAGRVPPVAARSEARTDAWGGPAARRPRSGRGRTRRGHPKNRRA